MTNLPVYYKLQAFRDLFLVPESKDFQKNQFLSLFCNLRKTEYLHDCWQTNQCNKETERSTQKQFHDSVFSTIFSEILWNGVNVLWAQRGCSKPIIVCHWLHWKDGSFESNKAVTDLITNVHKVDKSFIKFYWITMSNIRKGQIWNTESNSPSLFCFLKCFFFTRT